MVQFLGSTSVTTSGRPVRAQAIDPAGAGHVLEAFRLFADEGWSPGRVARLFNQRQVAGRTSWGRTNVVQLLTRQTYAGVEWYNRTTQRRDPDTGTVTVTTRPRDEWLRREVPGLRIVPDDLWARAQARLAAVRDAHRARAGGPTAPARTVAYPTVLVRPVCGYCRVPLWVGRSGKYPSLHCHRGREERSGCQLRSYKSARIVDRAVLDRLRPLAADPAFAARVAAAANAALAAEAARPAADVGPLRAEVRRLERAQAKLVELAEQDAAGDLSAVARRLRQNEHRLTALRAEVAAADGRAAAPPPALTPAAVAGLLADLPGLLADDVAAAADALAGLTGPVVVTQEGGAGGRAPAWVARFTLQGAPVLARLARRRECPTADTWESGLRV